jgi:hypothetical protein
MSGGSNTKKEYILVSSDYRAADSVSTTDFTLRMLVPIKNVIKTDLIQVSMDYNVANIRQGASPGADNSFALGDGNGTVGEGGVVSGGTSSAIGLEEGLYTIDVLASWIQEQLTIVNGAGWAVFYGIDAKLMIAYTVQEAGDVPENRELTCGSVVLSKTLGLLSPGDFVSTSGSVAPNVSLNEGDHGTYRWYFPFPVQLSGIYPYLFIQSRALGTDIKVANGNLGFWRMLLNDQVNYSLSETNNRVDAYTNTPITLQDIDIKLVYPDGTTVNNNGGRFTLLLEIVRLL